MGGWGIAYKTKAPTRFEGVGGFGFFVLIFWVRTNFVLSLLCQLSVTIW